MGKPPSLNRPRASHKHYKALPATILEKKLHKPKVTAHTVKGPKSVRNKKALAKRIRHLNADSGNSSSGTKEAKARLAGLMDVDEAKQIVANEHKGKTKATAANKQKAAAPAAPGGSGMEVEEKGEAEVILNPVMAEAKAKVMAQQHRAFLRAQGHHRR